LRRIQPDASPDETGFLDAFDSNRDLICAAAAKIYVRGSRGSYDLVAANFWALFLQTRSVSLSSWLQALMLRVWPVDRPASSILFLSRHESCCQTIHGRRYG